MRSGQNPWHWGKWPMGIGPAGALAVIAWEAGEVLTKWLEVLGSKIGENLQYVFTLGSMILFLLLAILVAFVGDGFSRFPKDRN